VEHKGERTLPLNWVIVLPVSVLPVCAARPAYYERYRVFWCLKRLDPRPYGKGKQRHEPTHDPVQRRLGQRIAKAAQEAGFGSESAFIRAAMRTNSDGVAQTPK